MKYLLTVTAIVEGCAGLMFEVLPSQMSKLVFGTSLSTSIEFALARGFGIGLIGLAVICWLTRHDGQSHTVRGIVGGLMVFEAGCAIGLLYANIVSGLSSIFFWPFVLIHLVMATWCIVCLRKRPD